MGGSDHHAAKESMGGGEGRRGARGRGRRRGEKGRSGRKKRMDHPHEEDVKEGTGGGSVSSERGSGKREGREEGRMRREDERRDVRMFSDGNARGDERKERAYEKALEDGEGKEDERRRGGFERGDVERVNGEEEKRRREEEGEAREEEKREEKSGEEESVPSEGERSERIRRAEGRDSEKEEIEEGKERGVSPLGERSERMREAEESEGGAEGGSIVSLKEERGMMRGDWKRGREEERESEGKWERGEGGFTLGMSGESRIIPTGGVEVSRSTPPASLEEDVTEAGGGVTPDSPPSQGEEPVSILPRSAGTVQVDVFDRLERIARTYRQEELPFDLHEQPPLPQNVYRAHLDELYAQLRRAYQLAQQDVYAINVYRLAEETERLARLRELGWRDEKRFWQSLSLLERLLERAPLLRKVLPQHVPHWERIEEELEYYNAYRQRKK